MNDDGELLRVAAACLAHDQPEALVEAVLDASVRALGADAGQLCALDEGLHQRLLVRRGVEMAGDLRALVERVAQAGTLRIDPAEGFQSGLATIALASGRPAALLCWLARDENAFDDASIARAQKIAALVGAPLARASRQLADTAGHAQDAVELRVLRRVAETLSFSFDLQVVMERGLELALDAAGATAGVMYVRDDRRGHYQRVALRGLDAVPATAPLDATDARIPLSASLRALDETPIDFSATELAHALVAPLRIEADPQGFFAAFFRPDEFVLPSTILTVDAIARHVSIAIRNARIHEISERRARVAHILREFSERAIDPLEDGPLANLILDTALLLCRCDRGLVARVAPPMAKVLVAAGVDSDLVGMSLPVNTPYLRDALASRAPTIVEDTTTLDPNSVIAQVARAKRTASFLLIVMRHGDVAMGYVFAGCGEQRRFEPEEIEGLQILATMGGELLERARRRREIEAEHRQRAAIVEKLPIVVAVIRQNGEVVHMNEAGRAFATAWSSMPSGDWREGLQRVRTANPDGSARDPEDNLLLRAFRGEHPPPKELLLSSEDGTKQMNVISVAAPIFGPDGTVDAVVTGFQDVTALRELADARDRFLRIAAHELRSPLTALRATASLFEIDPAVATDPERRRMLIERVQRQVARLTRLIEQLIDSARMSAQEAPLERRSCDLVRLCRDVIAAPRSPSTPAIVLDETGPIVGNWDTDRMEQVLTNLLSNAARYSPADSTITVRLRARDEVASLEVIDQGIGIPEEQIERVFTPFFRASNAAARHKGGLGLGLHIANEIVRRHGGTMRVASTVHVGSTFIVELPLG